MAELDDVMLQPEFWNDQQKAQGIINESNALKDQVNEFNELFDAYENLDLTYELVKEEDDEELQSDLENELVELTTRLNQFELQLLLSDPYDKNNAILELHPGAGGTESQDFGFLCCFECTHAGQRKKALRWRHWIIYQVMKLELKV